MINHTSLLNREREKLEELGHTIYVENQNSFRLRDRQATLAGEPDLITSADCPERMEEQPQP